VGTIEERYPGVERNDLGTLSVGLGLSLGLLDRKSQIIRISVRVSCSRRETKNERIVFEFNEVME
jgi:hypothetical protein